MRYQNDRGTKTTARTLSTGMGQRGWVDRRLELQGSKSPSVSCRPPLPGPVPLAGVKGTRGRGALTRRAGHHDAALGAPQPWRGSGQRGWCRGRRLQGSIEVTFGVLQALTQAPRHGSISRGQGDSAPGDVPVGRLLAVPAMPPMMPPLGPCGPGHFSLHPRSVRHWSITRVYTRIIANKPHEAHEDPWVVGQTRRASLVLREHWHGHNGFCC